MDFSKIFKYDLVPISDDTLKNIARLKQLENFRKVIKMVNYGVTE